MFCKELFYCTFQLFLVIRKTGVIQQVFWNVENCLAAATLRLSCLGHGGVHSLTIRLLKFVFAVWEPCKASNRMQSKCFESKGMLRLNQFQ